MNLEWENKRKEHTPLSQKMYPPFSKRKKYITLSPQINVQQALTKSFVNSADNYDTRRPTSNFGNLDDIVFYY